MRLVQGEGETAFIIGIVGERGVGGGRQLYRGES